ncbi:hypothetical protein ABZ443_45775, partial [Streptomyces shenzhenensis]
MTVNRMALASFRRVRACAATLGAGRAPGPLLFRRLPGHVDAGLGPAQWAAYAGAGALGVLGFGG